MILRRTRNNAPGTYYRKLTPKQQKRVVAKWKQRRKAGVIKCVDDFKLACLKDHPDWEVMRRVRRVRIDGRTIEQKSYALCFGGAFRQVKAKPRPVTIYL